jgi:hypothetical protein
VGEKEGEREEIRKKKGRERERGGERIIIKI